MDWVQTPRFKWVQRGCRQSTFTRQVLTLGCSGGFILRNCPMTSRDKVLGLDSVWDKRWFSFLVNHREAIHVIE
jgi:hypothetical protein